MEKGMLNSYDMSDLQCSIKISEHALNNLAQCCLTNVLATRTAATSRMSHIHVFSKFLSLCFSFSPSPTCRSIMGL